MQAWKKPLRIAVVAVLAAALSGCLKTEYVATIGANDTMTGSVTSYAPVSAIQEIATKNDNPEELVAVWRENTAKAVTQISEDIAALDAPDPATVLTATDISDEEIIGMQVSFENLSFPQPAEGVSPFKNGFLPGMSGIEISREGDLQVLSGTLGSKSGETVEDLAGSGSLQAIIFQGQGLEPTVSLSVTFAGPIESTNGTVEGNTVTWTTPQFETLKIEATAAVPFQEGAAPVVEGAGGGGISPMLVVTVALFLAFAGGGAYVFITGRRQDAADDSDEYSDYYEDDYYDGEDAEYESEYEDEEGEYESEYYDDADDYDDDEDEYESDYYEDEYEDDYEDDPHRR